MNGESYEILVLGAACLDMKVRAKTLAIEPGHSNPGQIRWSWGGVARNIAENLTRLGAHTRLITAVGDDEAGRELLNQAHRIGIDTEGSLVVTGQETAAYVGVYHVDERLWVAFDDMAIIEALTPGYLYRHRRFFKQADMVCADANLSVRALETLFRLAQEYDVPIVVDPTTALLASKLRPYLAQITAITPNRQEAEALLQEPLPDDEALLYGARSLVKMGVELAIVTLGAAGLAYATSEESGRLPTFEAAIVDPIGAGDALTAALAYGLMEELAPTEAVRLGLAAAAQTIICQETVCPTLNLETLYERLVV
ncbi:MAG: carbohydrate kinase family protein [Anaerolineales bacterium]